jgi:hypothetical protein
MPATEIRSAIQAWLAPPAIPGLTVVYRAMPVRMLAEDWPIGVDTGWGAGAYLHLSDISEQRIAYGGAPPGGLKRVTYAAALVVFYRWQYTGNDPTNTTDGWASPFDQLIGDITTRLRADRTLGCGPAGPVWQAGEGVDGGDDIHTQMDLPTEDEGQIVQWAAVQFTVVEMANT